MNDSLRFHLLVTALELGGAIAFAIKAGWHMRRAYCDYYGLRYPRGYWW